MARWTSKDPKPPTRFCWECSRQLRGRQHHVIIGPDGNQHAVHKTCVGAHQLVVAEARRREREGGK